MRGTFRHLSARLRRARPVTASDGWPVAFVGLVAKRHNAVVAEDDVGGSVPLLASGGITPIDVVTAGADHLDGLADAERCQLADALAAHDLALEAGRETAAAGVATPVGSDDEEKDLNLSGGHADPVVGHLDLETLVRHGAAGAS